MLKTWLCANLGVVYVACALILLGIAAIFLPVSFKGDDHALWLIAAIGIGCVSFVFFSLMSLLQILYSLLLKLFSCFPVFTLYK